jgi:hypothetical protein
MARKAGTLVCAGGAVHQGHLPPGTPTPGAHGSQEFAGRGMGIRASAGRGSKGDRLYDWACVPLADPDTVEAGRWLLLRRDIDDPSELAYYLAYGPKDTSVGQLVRLAGRRWVIEDCFEAAKVEVGLDEYEVRKWDAWHRHITLCLLAHAYLAVLRSEAAKRGMQSAPN